jgi:hypothetical protein
MTMENVSLESQFEEENNKPESSSSVSVQILDEKTGTA